jgi:hypothetical protein
MTEAQMKLRRIVAVVVVALTAHADRALAQGASYWSRA